MCHALLFIKLIKPCVPYALVRKHGTPLHRHTNNSTIVYVHNTMTKMHIFDHTSYKNVTKQVMVKLNQTLTPNRHVQRGPI